MPSVLRMEQRPCQLCSTRQLFVFLPVQLCGVQAHLDRQATQQWLQMLCRTRQQLTVEAGSNDWFMGKSLAGSFDILSSVSKRFLLIESLKRITL